MKREVRLLLTRAIDSLVLSIEHFNRPWDRGRPEASLIFLDRSFELLMKAALLQRRVAIRPSPDEYTIGFKRCVNRCVSGAKPPIFTEDEAVTLRLINGLRDAAQHHLLGLSEPQLYVYVQAGVTLFANTLADVFGQTLEAHLPERVVPVSTHLPKDLESVLEADFEDIKELLKPGARRRLEAKARLRPFAILEAALDENADSPTQGDLEHLGERIRHGEHWTNLFPGVAQLELSSEGTGLSVSIRITKREGTPVMLVKEGKAEVEQAAVVAVRRVAELDYYSLNTTALARKVHLTVPKLIALIRYLKLQESEKYFRELVIDGVTHKRYSRPALDLVRETLPQVDMAAVWTEHRPRRKKD